MPISVALSTFGGVNGSLFTSSRSILKFYFSFAPSVCIAFPALSSSGWLTVSLSQVVLCRCEGGSSSPSAGNDSREPLHTHPRFAFHCELFISSLNYVKRCLNFKQILVYFIVFINSADVVHQWHLHPHQLCWFHQLPVLWSHCCRADCASHQRTRHTSANQGTANLIDFIF